MATLLVDNSGAGDIFTASSSGLPRFTVANNGNILLGPQYISSPVPLTVLGSQATGSNTNGVNISFTASNGTGTGNSGAFLFNTSVATQSGVLHDNDSGFNSGTGASSATWSHTVSSGIVDTLLVVGIDINLADTVSSITYNGVALTHLATQACTSTCHTELWYLKNPPTGTHNIVVSWTGGNSHFAGGASSYYNISQTTIFGTVAQQNGGNDSTVSMNVTTTADQLVIDEIGGQGGSSYTANAGQTVRWAQNTGGTRTSAGSSKPATGTTTTMGWSGTAAGPYGYIAVGINPNPISVSATAPNTLAQALEVAPGGNVVVGSSALSVNANDGFLYIPTSAGAPSGTPTSYSGTVPMEYDTTDNKLYIYNGTSWVGGNTPGTFSDYSEWAPAPGASSSAIVSLTNQPNPINDLTAPFLLGDSSTPYDKSVVGIISQYAEQANEAHGIKLSSDYHAVALVGRVPVKVSTINGPIHTGDYLTTSSILGSAMVATRSGQMIGKATQDFDGSLCNSNNPASESAQLVGNVCEGQIIAFVQPTYADPNDILSHFSVDANGNASASGQFTATQINTNTLKLPNGTIGSDTFGNIIHQLATDTTSGTPNKFIFRNASGNNLLSLDSNGNATLSGTLTTSKGNYDVAEDYPTKDTSLVPGDILSIDQTNAGHVQKSISAYDRTIIGVYSDKPGFRLSESNGMIIGDKAIPVALTGRVPVKVSLENGIIHKGDELTSSSTPGVAMKATHPGQILGKALEDFVCTSSSISCSGTIMAFVNVTFADPNNVLSQVAVGPDGKLLVSAIDSTSVSLPAGIQINGKFVSGSVNDALNALTTGVTNNTSTINTLTTQANGLASMTQDIGNRVANLETTTASLSAQTAVNSKQIASTAAQLAQTNTVIANLSTQLASAGATISSLSSKVSTLLSGISNNSVSGQPPLTISSLADVGIGTTIPNYKLDIQQATSSAVAQIDNESSDATSVGLQIKLGTTSPQTTNRFINFLDGNNNVLGSIRGNGTSDTVTFDGNGGDFAEYFKKADPQALLNTGDIICQAATGGVEKCRDTSNGILGVLSDDASFVGAARNAGNPDYVLVGLIGQLKVTVASDSAAIKSGDPVTFSPTQPGKAVKATEAGQILGRALESFDPQNPTDKILVSINVSWHDPQVAVTDSGNLALNGKPMSTSQLTLTVNKLQSQSIDLATFEASTSATLKSNADEISALQTQVATLSGNFSEQQSSIPVASSEGIFALSNLSDQISQLEKQLLSINMANTLASQDATISGTLTAFGNTMLNNVGITGTLTTGVMTIQGLDATGQTSINTVGDLKLQDQGIGGIDILAGKIKIDTNGNFRSLGEITAKKFNVDTSDVLSASLGTLTIHAGDTQGIATTSALTKNSKIFATPIDTPVAVSTKRTGEKTFIIRIAEPQNENLKINWWIVN